MTTLPNIYSLKVRHHCLLIWIAIESIIVWLVGWWNMCMTVVDADVDAELEAQIARELEDL